jgi:hypothetical protein
VSVRHEGEMVRTREDDGVIVGGRAETPTTVGALYGIPGLCEESPSTTTSSANFQSILDAALVSYAKQTGIDLIKHPSADKLQSCHSPDDVLQVFSERESAFKDHRDQYRNLIDRLRPVVHVVHAFSAVLGKVAGLVSSGIAFILADCILHLPTGAIPTNNSDICRR